MPFSDIMCPGNSISVPISNFFLEMVMLFPWHHSRTILGWLISSSSFSAQMMVSSTSFLAHFFSKATWVNHKIKFPHLGHTHWIYA